MVRSSKATTKRIPARFISSMILLAPSGCPVSAMVPPFGRLYWANALTKSASRSPIGMGYGLHDLDISDPRIRHLMHAKALIHYGHLVRSRALILSRVDRFHPILQVDVCFLHLPPGLPAVLQYFNQVPVGPSPSQNGLVCVMGTHLCVSRKLDHRQEWQRCVTRGCHNCFAEEPQPRICRIFLILVALRSNSLKQEAYPLPLLTIPCQ